jgi:3-hydroxyacyl-[acyl-carrier-protein] dehydratase
MSQSKIERAPGQRDRHRRDPQLGSRTAIRSCWSTGPRSIGRSQSIVGIKCVTVNEPFFQGHFPGNPVMPGVLIIEAMAQTGAVLMSKSLEVDVAGKTIFFMSVDNCRFRNPGASGRRGAHGGRGAPRPRRHLQVQGPAMVGDKTAAEAEFAAMVVETPA